MKLISPEDIKKALKINEDNKEDNLKMRSLTVIINRWKR